MYSSNYLRRSGVAPILASLLLIAACGERPTQAPDAAPIDLDAAAARYLTLALALAEHDPHFVISYYGPPELREAAVKEQKNPEEIALEARTTVSAIGEGPDNETPLVARRRAFLQAQLNSVAVRADMLSGRQLPFMQEAERVFGASIPELDARAHITSLHEQINRITPGQGLLVDRIARFRKQFIIPPERLPAVINAAVEECRRRTHAVLELPPERLEVEFASGVSWLTFNEFRGDGFSVIKINTDLPVYIDRAVDMGCHEGYPGHHTSNVLKEKELVRERGWQEFTVQTLFSPQTLVEEGLASYGVDLIFPHEERVAFEQDVLFELAGFDRAQAYRYLELMSLIAELAYADIEGARRYLDGEWDAGYTASWLINYRLLSDARARQRLAAFDTYRTFIGAGYVGKLLVREFLEGQSREPAGGPPWDALHTLLVTPTLPSDLRN